MLGAFGKYVPKNLVQQLFGRGEVPRLGGERRSLTVFFSDVRDFTRISEEVEPERLMEFTSEYLEGLVKVVLEHRGTVDKFVGDQIMAYWNAPTPNPSHATDACLAVLRCRNWSNAQNERWLREGTPILYTRFALHLGDAIVGNVGSSDRMDYTVVGAAINLGSRIEGLNKIYGTQVLISGAVADGIDGHFVRRPVDRVLPKGALHPLDVFELKGVLPGHAEPDLAVDLRTVALCAEWTRFYQRYLSRDWTSAGEALGEFVARFGADTLTGIYGERIGRFKAEPPPADWDGVIRYSTK
jgi:adenylate cyclase